MPNKRKGLSILKADAQDVATLCTSGPCLFCNKPLDYGRPSRIHRKWGDLWLAQQFEPAKRALLIAYLRGEIPAFEGRLHWASLGPYVCERCCSEAEMLSTQAARIRKQKWESVVAEYRFRTTWRSLNPGEFSDFKGTRRFLALTGSFELSDIEFHWRASKRCQCRGYEPGCVVVMLVDGVLTARYYGFHIKRQETPQCDEYYNCHLEYLHDEVLESDRFGKGFAYWLQKRFQPELRAAKPGLVWYASEGGRDPESGDGEWAIVHTVWMDGSVHATLRDLPTIDEVKTFASRVLGVQITEP